MKHTPIIFLLTILISTLSNAEWQNHIKPFENYSHPALTPVKLTYTMSWKGTIDSGTMTLELGKKDKRYPKAFISHINGRSTGLAATLFPYNFTFTSFSTKAYKPIVFVTHETDDKETVDIKNHYKPPGVIHQSTKHRLKKNKIKTKNFTFSAPQVHDAITAMLHVRGQPLKNGDTINLCILPFSSPYYGTIKVLGREKHLGKKCIKLSIHLSRIEKDTKKLKTYKKLKKATIWISDDSQRIPIELRSEVFIGDVRAVLQKQQNLPK